MVDALDQHAAWLARSIGRTDDLPMMPQDAEALAAAGTIERKFPGTHLFREGQAADRCYIVKDGEVELYRHGASTRLPFGRLGPGGVVGDIAMFQHRPYLSSARAVGEVRAIRLDRHELISLLLERPVLALRWLVNGLTQLETTQQRVIRLMHRSVAEQVAGVLVDERDTFGEVRMSQAVIGEMLGASRQSVNESIARLRTEGVIATGYRTITVLDADRLSLFASRDHNSDRRANSQQHI